MLRRWILIILLACLPLQGSLALALGYCQHESDAATQQQTHAGHHDHQHQAKAADDVQTPDASALEHGDCAQCHFGCSLGLATDRVAQFPVMGQAQSALVCPPRAGVAPDAIERVPLALPTSASF